MDYIQNSSITKHIHPLYFTALNIVLIDKLIVVHLLVRIHVFLRDLKVRCYDETSGKLVFILSQFNTTRLFIPV